MNAALHPLDWVALSLYLGLIVGIGVWFGKFTRTTSDFFFGGQRFSWWLIGVSCVATLVGSYSFVNYSEVGFNFGISSVTNYSNDWFVMPLFLLGWLPIIYSSRIQSIPEYFERRFDRRTRMLVLVLLLLYLEGYVGINLLTIGVAMNGLFGWNVVLSAAAMAFLSALYLHAGGQTSVLMTDLFQGFLLLAVGVGVFLAGVFQLGGFSGFWNALPEAHRLPFADFNSPPQFHFVGEFWNDAITGTFAFYFINQGVLMRFLSAKSVHDSRKAMIFVALFLMPVAAVAVGGAGWVGRAMVDTGLLPEGVEAQNAFVTVARAVSRPGIFGIVVAAMLAALMSTLDTLISAVSAIAVNDVWKVFRPGRPDAHYLKAARVAAGACTVVGIALIPVFQQFASIYQALSYFTAIITPPLVVVIFLAITWQRFSPPAAFWTLLLGSAAMWLSLIFPSLVQPLAHGVAPDFGFSYMRSFFGVVVSFVLGVGLTFSSRGGNGSPEPGLTLATLVEGEARFKGGRPSNRGTDRSKPLRLRIDQNAGDALHLPPEVLEELHVEPGEMVYATDARWWLGGFRSLHAKVDSTLGRDGELVISPKTVRRGNLRVRRPVVVERLN